jgi:hypothetical protein
MVMNTKDKVYTVRLTRHQMQALHGVLESQPHLSPELREIDDRLFNHLYVLERYGDTHDNG